MPAPTASRRITSSSWSTAAIPARSTPVRMHVARPPAPTTSTRNGWPIPRARARWSKPSRGRWWAPRNARSRASRTRRSPIADRGTSGRQEKVDVTMLRIDRVIGSRVDAAISERLHYLEHAGRVEILTLPAAEMARRRLRAATQAGTDLAIALPREQKLYDGAVLLLDEHRAIVVRAD